MEGIYYKKNAPAYRSVVVIELLNFPYTLLYSPDLCPSDLWKIPVLKTISAIVVFSHVMQ